MITLQQLKQFLSIAPAETSKDELLKGFINESVSEINSLCARKLDYSAHSEIINGTGGITIVLDNYPVSGVEKIEILNGDSWENLFTPPDNVADSAILLKEIGIIKLLKSYVLPKGEKNAKAEYSAGYKWADEWKQETAYAAGDMVRYLDTIYNCIEAHTSGLDFDETKWDADPAKAVPEMLAGAVKYLAAKKFYESPAGKNLFLKKSESYGDRQNVYDNVNIDQVIHIYRNTNI